MRWLKDNLSNFPGWLASGVMILIVFFWTYWGAGEMYHEGWWGAWYNCLPYLVPIAVTLLPALTAVRMPTTDELVRSMGRHGENAGCTWKGTGGM